MEMLTGLVGAAGAAGCAGACAAGLSAWRAAATAVAFLPAFTASTTVRASSGLRPQVLSSTRHWAIVMPHPQSQELAFSMSRAASFWVALSAEKSTPASPSLYCFAPGAAAAALSRAPLLEQASRSVKAVMEKKNERLRRMLERPPWIGSSVLNGV